jgi:hypothetical protein
MSSLTNVKVYYYRGLDQYSKNKEPLLETCLTGQDKYKKILDYLRSPTLKKRSPVKGSSKD